MSRGRILCVAGRKNSGKTTLIERLVPALRRRGLRVATVKRPPHAFELDTPGKDSYRHFHAGADASMVYGHKVVAVVRRLAGEPPVAELVAAHLADADLVLVEAHKSAALPKLEVFRAGSHPRPLCAEAGGFVAVASDEPLDAGVPCLPLDDPEAVAAFVVDYFGL